MPRNIFGEFVQPSHGLGTKKWYTLPLSIAAHMLAVAALVVIPLTAAEVLPTVTTMMAFTAAPPPPAPPKPPPPPPSAPQPAAPTSKLVAMTAAVPVTPPPAIVPEAPAPLAMTVKYVGVVGGVGSPLGQLGGVTLGTAPTAPVRVGGQVKEPTKLRGDAPIYPAVAIAAHASGEVLIEATISVDGKVQNERVVKSSSPLLNHAALDAVRRWEYAPTLLNGTPVPIILTVTVTFSLK